MMLITIGSCLLSWKDFLQQRDFMPPARACQGIQQLGFRNKSDNEESKAYEAGSKYKNGLDEFSRFKNHKRSEAMRNKS